MNHNQKSFSNQANKLEINVCDAPYHANGRGLANDRAVIQQAIDDAFEKGGGTVVLPEGKMFLSGELELKSNVTLRLEGVLLKSNNPDHYRHPAGFGREVKGIGLNWSLASYRNYPLIFTASGAANVAILGSGVMDMNYTGSDDTTVQTAGIGLYDTDHFIVRGITIRDSSQPQVWPVRCRNGEVAYVKILDPAPHWNNEAICMCNCQNMHIHHNYSICGDDNIDVWASYRDQRMQWWCSSENPQPSINIEIDHNILGQIGNGVNYNFVPWGGEAPDQEQVRIDNIFIHDNISLPYEVDPRVGDVVHTPHPIFRYQEWNERSTYGHSPLSNIRVYDNGIGNSTRHDGDEPHFPCVGFETNDITDPWFTDSNRKIIEK